MDSGQFWLLVLVLVLVLTAIGLPWLLGRRRSSRPWNATQAYLDTIDALVRGQKNSAVRVLERVAREEPENVGAFLRLGDLVRSMGHPEKAQKIHAGLAARNLDTPETRNRVKESLIEDEVALGNWSEVKRLAAELRQTEKKNLIALRALAQAHRAEKNWSAAFEALDEWERLAPGTARPRPHEIRMEAAQSRLESGEAPAARTLLEEVLALGGSESDAHILLGDVFAAEGEHEKATALWLDFARNHPDRAHVVFPRLERSYYEMGRFGELLEVYEDLIDRSAQSTAAALALADIHRRRGRPEEAVHLLESVLGSDPANARARRALIQCHVQSGHTEAAIEEVNALVEAMGEGSGEVTGESGPEESPSIDIVSARGAG